MDLSRLTWADMNKIVGIIFFNLNIKHQNLRKEEEEE
jgi:hypothetical protein